MKKKYLTGLLLGSLLLTGCSGNLSELSGSTGSQSAGSSSQSADSSSQSAGSSSQSADISKNVDSSGSRKVGAPADAGTDDKSWKDGYDDDGADKKSWDYGYDDEGADSKTWDYDYDDEGADSKSWDYDYQNYGADDNSWDGSTAEVAEDWTGDDVDGVTAYLVEYDRLPDNYMTKKEARKYGWEGGALHLTVPDMCIGGDCFGNNEGLLPEYKDYHEADIDTLDSRSRGAERLIYSVEGDDLDIWYTDDHYESFDLVYGDGA